MAASYWRDKSRRIIAERIVEAEKQGMDLAGMKKHISSAYPFGERAMHPYKIWCSEVKLQTKRFAPKPKTEIVEWPWKEEGFLNGTLEPKP